MRNVQIKMAERFSNGLRRVRIRALITDGAHSTYAEWTNTNCFHHTETVVEVNPETNQHHYRTVNRVHPVETWMGATHYRTPARRYYELKFTDEHQVFDHILRWSKRCTLHHDRHVMRKTDRWLNDQQF